MARLALVFGGVCLILIVATIVTGIVSRALFNYPLSWGVELTTILVIWAVYAVLGVNYRDGGHLSVNVFANLLGPRAQRVLDFLADAVTATVVVVMIVHGATAMRMNDGMTTMALDVSVSLAYYLAAELGCISLLAYLVAKYVRKAVGEPRR